MSALRRPALVATAMLCLAAPSFAAPSVTTDFLVGAWGVEGCDPPAATYSRDGFLNGGSGRWRLKNGQLITEEDGERHASAVERLGPDRMRLNTADGAFELKRCR
ncbi:hypothetical protein [Hansschlegelia beijingensis]|uniref:DUF2147 domain-containing protein n=1 Tax=Hansschlegelia beijingensis TaxID=1133344 RepID=A0A7W6GF46_9HYPH|nr:hypothetical protein [Hansschlegelia beijingensis]MBB3972738.1 hypothetical protein [Hansschlegelia beijingensis]